MKLLFNEKMKGDRPLIGTLLSLPLPEVAEIVSSAGFDWVFIDAEHSSLDFRQVQSLLQALDSGCSGLVRVPLLDEIWIKKVLDAGPEGIIIPNIKTAEEARQAVQFCRYPPEGTRSVGIGRAHSYGMDFSPYLNAANRDLSVILQLEHREAFENAGEILEVKGFDAVFIGPYDYSASVNKTGRVHDKEVQEAIAAVREHCFRKQIPVGIFGTRPEAVRPYICQGYTLIAVGMDILFLGNAAADTLQSLRPGSF